MSFVIEYDVIHASKIKKPSVMGRLLEFIADKVIIEPCFGDFCNGCGIYPRGPQYPQA